MAGKACGPNGAQWVGDPVDVTTGEVRDRARDFTLAGPRDFHWDRHYSTFQVDRDHGLGFGHRHGFDRALRFDLDGIRYAPPTGERIDFGHLLYDGATDLRQGHVLERVRADRFQVRRAGEPVYEFRRPTPQARLARLTRAYDGAHEAFFDYDARGRLIAIVDYTGRTLRIDWDERGHIRAILWMRPEGPKKLVEYEYDTNGLLVSGRDPYGHVFTWAYNSHGWVSRRTDRRGYGFVFEYDGLGRCIRSAGDDGVEGVRLFYAPAARETVVVHEEDDARWVYRYAPEGSIVEIEDPFGGIKTFQFNDAGEVVGEIDEAGDVYPYLKDGTGHAYAKRDPFGYLWPIDENPAAPTKDPLAHDVPTHALAHEHGGLQVDGFEVPRQASLPTDLPRDVSALLLARETLGHEREVFDAHGTRIRVELRDGATRRFRYDANGNLVRYVDYDGASWRYEYVSWNQWSTQTDPLGHLTELAWSKRDKLVRLVDPGGTESRYEYDARDRLTAVHRHGKVREQYVYGLWDELIEKRGPDGQSLVTFGRGPRGLMTRRETRCGQVHALDYDGRGRLCRAKSEEGDCTYSYSVGGQRTADLRDGRGVRHRFLGSQVTETSVLDRFVVRYRRPEAGITLVIDPTDRVHRLQLMGAGILRRDLSNGTTEVSQYDPRGHCVLKARYSAGAHSLAGLWHRCFRRSGEGDLLTREDSVRGKTVFRHDAAHRLEAVQHPDGRVDEYEYDAAGNLLRKPGLSEGFLEETAGYDFDTSKVALTRGNRLYRANGDRFHYDERDHVAVREGRSGRWVYHHDSLDRLRRIDGRAADGSHLDWHAEYDVLGRRIRKRIGDQQHEYWWDTDRLAAELLPDGRFRVYVYADARALVPMLFVEYASIDADPTTGTRYYLFCDHRGCPERVEDDAGRIVWEAFIAPYGECDVRVGADFHQPLRFPGHFWDAETGLHYNRFRYYSPELGRYLESDPLGIEGGVNLYAYTDNPLRDVDVLGLRCPECGAEGGAQHEEGCSQEGAEPARVGQGVSDDIAEAIGDAGRERYVAGRMDELRSGGPGAHGPQRHEGDVSSQQLKDRVVHKHDPMTGSTLDGVHGGTHQCGKTATKVNSEAAYVQADDYLRSTDQFRSDTADESKTFVVVEEPLEDIFGTGYVDHVSGVTGHSNNYPTGSPPGSVPLRQTDFTDGTMKALYKRDPATGSWYLYTMYPNPQ